MRFPLQKTEELGIDRPTFIWALNLSYRGDRGATAEPGDLTSVYGTVPGRWLPMAAAAVHSKRHQQTRIGGSSGTLKGSRGATRS